MLYKGSPAHAYIAADDLATGTRRSGIASTIGAAVDTDGTTTTVTAGGGSGIVEIGATGVYRVPLTASQMNGEVVVIIGTTTTTGVVMGTVTLVTDGGRIDATVGSRLASSSYTAPPTPPTAAQIASAVAAPTAASIASTVWSGSDTRSLSVAPPTAAVIASTVASSLTIPTTAQIAAAITVPTAAANASAVWGASARTLTASPTDISSLATASQVTSIDASISAIGESVGTITARIPTSGTVATAADIVSSTATVSTLISSIPPAPTAAATATAVWNSSARTDISELATAADVTSATATIAASIGEIDVSASLTTEQIGEIVDGVTDAIGEGISVPTAAQNASAVWGASARTLTASPTDISSLATASELATVQSGVSAIQTGVSSVQTGVTAVQTGVTTIGAAVSDVDAAVATVQSSLDALTCEITPADLALISNAVTVAVTKTVVPAITAQVVPAVLGTNVCTLSDPEVGSLYTLLMQQINATVDRSAGTLKLFNPDGSEHATVTAVLGDAGQILGFRIRNPEITG